MESFSGAKPVKILFVDDEPNVLRSLRRLFMDEDRYELLIAESGAAGLEIMEQEAGSVCVVVSDYRMPGMNGVEFLSQVNERWPKTIRIVLSGYADTASVVEAINIGHIYKFIPKPWNDDELQVNIANAVDTCILNQQNDKLAEELAQRNRQLQDVNANLETLVHERTADLELRTKVLQVAQDILDCVPVAVIGIDSDGYIVQVNDYANKIVSQHGSLLGELASVQFEPGLLAFLEQVKLVGEVTDNVNYNKLPWLAMGQYLNNNPQQGIVLTLIPMGGG
ncbi:MAG: hypothetical protein BA874_09145 [Desulfuromonadales bacterium C00003068]|nr:MAG: hypothetical protein BA874_09145 [Desulfuromonadales bacterium C00003068]